MQKNKGAGCLAITRSTVDVLLSLAAQTSRSALIALAVVGIGIPMTVHAFHGRHMPRPAGQLAQVGPVAAKAAVKLISSLHQTRRTVG